MLHAIFGLVPADDVVDFEACSCVWPIQPDILMGGTLVVMLHAIFGLVPADDVVDFEACSCVWVGLMGGTLVVRRYCIDVGS